MSGPLVLLTPDELARIVREQVDAALAEMSDDAAPALVDRQGLAKALGVSPGTVDKLRGEGAPEIRIGDCPRFEVAAVVGWLRSRGRP